MMLSTLIKTLLLPPALQIICIVVGLLMWRMYRRLAIASLLAGLMSLWLLSTPVIGLFLHVWLEAPFQAYTPDEPPQGVEAIVVLGAGRHYQAAEYGDDTLSHSALWRLRYGGYLAKRWDLPVIVSGGNVREFERLPEAAMGADFLKKELGVTTVWQEDRSRNTWENAQFTRDLLIEKSINKVVLVTHGYHMRRSTYSFMQAGVEHIAMPTGLVAHHSMTGWWGNWLPSAGALGLSYRALHEYMGLLFYRLKSM